MIRTAVMLVALTTLAACGGQRWLDREVPAACRDDWAACDAFAEIEARWRAALAVYDEGGLTAYVQDVTDRVARASRLAAAPRVVLLDSDAGAAMVRAGTVIFVRRDVLAVFDSEAELAAMLAHELVHIEGRHLDVHVTAEQQDDDTWRRGRVDDEAVADERAVGLLVAAGYPPTAMLSMMRALDRMTERESPGRTGDPDHPAPAARLARIAAIAATYPAAGDLHRDRYLHHLDGMVVGVDPRQGVVRAHTWIALSPAVALPLADWRVSDEGPILTADAADTALVALTISGPWARTLAARLRDRRATRAAGHAVVRGTMPADFERPSDRLSSLDRLLERALNRAWHPPVGSEVAVLDAGPTALLLAVDGPAATARLDTLLASLRAPTPAERALHPARITIVPAAVSGPPATVLLATCPAYAPSLTLAPPTARTRGDPIACITPASP